MDKTGHVHPSPPRGDAPDDDQSHVPLARLRLRWIFSTFAVSPGCSCVVAAEAGVCHRYPSNHTQTNKQTNTTVLDVDVLRSQQVYTMYHRRYKHTMQIKVTLSNKICKYASMSRTTGIIHNVGPRGVGTGGAGPAAAPPTFAVGYSGPPEDCRCDRLTVMIIHRWKSPAFVCFCFVPN